MSVLAIPCAHPYVQALQPAGGWTFTEFLPDPVVNPARPEQWWPHPAFEQPWWEERDRQDSAEHIDLVHLHFGYEHLTVQQTRNFIKILRTRRIPLVLTVHDIDNPHVVDQQAFHAQLRILLDDAARILTLTEAARTRLSVDFHVDPRLVTVVSHPRIVENPEAVIPAQHGTDIGVFLKSVRTNVVSDPAFYQSLAERCASQGRELSVFLHRDQEGSVLHRVLAETPSLNVVVHDPFSDAELFAAVAECSAIVLPYVRGTHSGWLEMCRDLDVPVAIPDCGCYADQLDSPEAGAVYHVADARSAAVAAVRLAEHGHVPLVASRDEQREYLLQVHEEIYRELSTPKLNIALIAPARFPIAQPFAGGLEAFCATMVMAYRQLGHRVDLYAAAGSAGHVREWEFPGVDWTGYEHYRTDHTYPPGERQREDAAFAQVMAHVQEQVEAGEYDVIHNNSLHPAPFETCGRLPMLTTIHTPVGEDMQRAICASVDAGGPEAAGIFAAVSHAAASTWNLPEPPRIIPNGFDGTVWRPGPGGPRAVWFGRVVPEKGLHLAIDAARELGVELAIAGRVGNEIYYEEEILPRLGADTHWVGESTQMELTELVSKSSVCFVTPDWEEPFGLVVIEALACGTPVAALARGGVSEILADYPGALADPEHPIEGLVKAAEYGLALEREKIAQWARSKFGDKQLALSYTELLHSVALRNRVPQ